MDEVVAKAGSQLYALELLFWRVLELVVAVWDAVPVVAVCPSSSHSRNSHVPLTSDRVC